MEHLKQLYESWKGYEPTSIQLLPAAGSNRKYYRISDADGSTVIGVEGTSVEENKTFIYLAEHFAKKGLPTPKVLAQSNDSRYYIQQDLGDTSLFKAIEGGRNAGGEYSAEEKELLRHTISLLPDMQFKGAEGLDFGKCYPQPEFDRTGIMFDLNYFKYCFLKATGIDFNELKLEHDFCQMATDLIGEDSNTFLYRDFQARNVMLDKDGNPFFIDFQGGRKGAIQYDVASFLWQASAKYPQELRNELIDVYLDSASRYAKIDKQQFTEKLNLYVLFRILQVLGAYGFRGYFERKKHFVESIPPAIENLKAQLAICGQKYAYLHKILGEMAELPQFKPQVASVSKYDGQGELTVTVYSFSYKKGIPTDESGNGGGYVFDCRSTHNPGRYEPYKPLTGLDAPVIKILEDDGEILTFLESVYKLVDAHTERFMKRGFTHLMCCFGCTGGRHRSVYSAQHVAEHLHQKYGVKVHIIHREQNIDTWL